MLVSLDTSMEFRQWKPEKFTRHEKYRCEDERLKTFDNWPLEWLDKRELANTGLFYTGDGDTVQCYFCEIELSRWERDDDPFNEHIRFSPNCPLLRRKHTNNVKLNDDNDKKEEKKEEEDLAKAIKKFRPEYPEYITRAARLRSFATWPRYMKPKPEQLVDVGFFYTGIGDRVKCFSCGCGLKDWVNDNELWEQHAFWSPQCRYVNPPDDIPDEKLCRICFFDKYNTLFLPCCHVLACYKCSSSISNCPVCRYAVTNVMRIFLP